MRSFVRECEPTRVSLENYLLVLFSESGLDPAASSGVAWGLNQAQGPLLRAAGYTREPSTFTELGVSDQMPFVGRMLRQQIREVGHVPESAEELWRMNLSPAAERSQSDVIYSRGTRNYDANAALDANRDGVITLSDLAARLAPVRAGAAFQRHLAQLRRVR
jgi:hypothetical protein